MPKHAPTVTRAAALAVARLWEPGVHDVAHVRDGESSVWAFEGSSRHILRVTSEVHRTRNLLLGELAFVEHLAAHGMNVARPVQPRAGEHVVDVTRMVGSEHATYATAFERLEGRHFEFYSDDIAPPLFQEWGRAMARLHVLAAAFSAPPELRRPDWSHDEVAGCSIIGADVDDRLLQLRNELVGWLGGMAHDPTRYGMVHGDFEKTNFVLNGGAIGLFDFDDCCHHWFCWDIVCALWVFRNATPEDRTAFLGWFLDGYGSVREPDTALLARFSDLVRLRTVALLLYRARARAAPATDEWAQRNRLWLDSTWRW